ncbi:MAG: Gfo/Idh/MocA family oxidoreductase, partial [Bdellovibrionales bacterium]|nr:Gfo/Idh/MocA family oxidoreductase [Oligoflexia bacterium]
MQITPLILGRGRSGQAISKSLVSLGILHPQFQISTPIGLERDVDLVEVRKKYAHPLLCISNPHGLHADAILGAASAGFEAIICEKPACVNLEQLQKLRAVKVPVAVLHGYRQMWGIQTLKQMIAAGELGEVITIEGRYWQASTADRALSFAGVSDSWKNEVRLSGESDTFLDIATHWVDAVSYLFGSLPTRIQGWKTNLNSETPHRDSHVQLALDYSKSGRGFGSISKTVHGSTNHFEINVLGTKKSVTWEFLKPDELFIGEGR